MSFRKKGQEQYSARVIPRQLLCSHYHTASAESIRQGGGLWDHVGDEKPNSSMGSG